MKSMEVLVLISEDWDFTQCGCILLKEDRESISLKRKIKKRGVTLYLRL